MPSFTANDGINLRYETYGESTNPPLILLHGFTGSSAVFQRNTTTLSKTHFVIVPDLRGHGSSQKPKAGYHVSRLALDLRNLLSHFNLLGTNRKGGAGVKAIGTSLGAAILWSYAELFTSSPFSHMIFVDQAPLQNEASDWGKEFCNRGMNNPFALKQLQDTLATSPADAHRGTIAACLGYRYDPRPGDPVEGEKEWIEDEEFFLGEAMKGDPVWFGKLMGDHTALDWRDSIVQNFSKERGVQTKVLVVASSRSGCFPAEGCMKVVELVNGGEMEGLARGEVVEWGGHWCYWEKPEMFNELVLDFLGE